MTEDSRDRHAERHLSFRATLAQLRVRIIDCTIELRNARWSGTFVAQLRNWVREMAEQGGEFGYVELAQKSRELQVRLESVLGDQRPSREMLGSIAASLERMNMLVEQVLLREPAERAAQPDPAPPARPRLLLAAIERDLSALIEQVALGLGMQVVTVSDSDTVRKRVGQDAVDLLVIEEGLLRELDPDFGRAGAVGRLFGDTPWLLLSAHPDIDLRLRALRAGAAACLAQPVDVAELDYALRLSTLSFSRDALSVQVVADDPELADRHAQTVRDAGLTPLLGAELAHLPDVLAGQAADALLLDLNVDIQQCAVWLNLLADTPGFDCLPVVCLIDERKPPACRHRRVQFLPAQTSAGLLAQAIRRAVLENARDASRVARLARIGEDARLCTADAFMAHLTAVVASDDEQRQHYVLLAAEFDDAITLLRKHGASALSRRQARLETCLLDALGSEARLSRSGSCGMLAVSIASNGLSALRGQLQVRLDASTGDPADALAGHCRVALLPLASLRSAAAARRRIGEALREPVGGTTSCIRLLEPGDADSASAATRSPLPVECMSLQLQPLCNVGGSPQSLHDAVIRLCDEHGQPQPLDELLSDVVARSLATELDVWEMHAIAARLRQWPDAARGIEIAMRLSTASRESVTLVPVVREVMATLPPGRGFRLVFEVAESWLVEHNVVAVEMVEALRGLGCGVMLGDLGSTDNPRNIAWASWFDYARLSRSRIADVVSSQDRRLAIEKLVRTSCARGARVIGSDGDDPAVRSSLAAWGVGLFS